MVIIGVHSPKFEHEKDAQALAAAVERYDVEHPVLDDPELITWGQYAAKAWPTLAVVDPNGYLIASMAGEGHAEGLARLIDELIAIHDADGTLRRGDGPYVPPAAADTALRFPGKALVTAAGTYLVSSSAHHQLVELEADGETVRRRIGTGVRGRVDGAAASAQFSEPQGMCTVPNEVADSVGYDIVVADTVNHLLRGVNSATGEVVTVAGTGSPWRSDPGPHAHDATSVDLSSPWDIAWFDDKVIIAMAGIHELWWFDPIKRTTGVYAGTTVEALKDGPLAEVWMAQPSGLSAVGDKLWVADSESSSVRWVTDGEMHTAVGQGLFDFGLVDGPAETALLQHPLGVCGLPDGSVLVADTYNGAVRLIKAPAGDSGRVVTTVATGLSEPSDIVIGAGGEVIVVESGAHRLTASGSGRPECGRSHQGRRTHEVRAPADDAPAGHRSAGRHFHSGTGTEARRVVRSVDQAAGHRFTTRAPGGGLGRHGRVEPRTRDRRRHRRWRVASRGTGCDLRRGRRVRRLPSDSTRLGCADQGRRRRCRPAAADPARPRRGLTTGSATQQRDDRPAGGAHRAFHLVSGGLMSSTFRSAGLAGRCHSAPVAAW